MKDFLILEYCFCGRLESAKKAASKSATWKSGVFISSVVLLAVFFIMATFPSLSLSFGVYDRTYTSITITASVWNIHYCSGSCFIETSSTKGLNFALEFEIRLPNPVLSKEHIASLLGHRSGFI